MSKFASVGTLRDGFLRYHDEQTTALPGAKKLPIFIALNNYPF